MCPSCGFSPKSAMAPQRKEKEHFNSLETSFLLCITYAHIDWYFFFPPPLKHPIHITASVCPLHTLARCPFLHVSSGILRQPSREIFINVLFCKSCLLPLTHSLTHSVSAISLYLNSKGHWRRLGGAIERLSCVHGRALATI